MGGFITERHLDEAEEAFPGILVFWRALPHKPRTFLELVALFDGWRRARPPRTSSRARAACRRVQEHHQTH